MTHPIPTHMIDRPIGPEGLPVDPADGYPRVLWRDPARRCGYPCFFGRGITLDIICARVAGGDTVDQIADDMDLNPEHVRAAVRRFTPILFKADLVRAILDGRKTATRRTNVTDAYLKAHKPGTVLWVRESYHAPLAGPSWQEVISKSVYRANMDAMEASRYYWSPGVHMPAPACRLWLTVTGCRVERLGDIDDAGARAEGFENRQAFIDAFCRINRCEFDPNQLVTVIEFTASTTPPLGWGDYLDEIEIKKAKKAGGK